MIIAKVVYHYIYIGHIGANMVCLWHIWGDVWFLMFTAFF
nr:MAG TPA: hypothetical protein [Caudoviricetes sp.]